MKLKCRCGQMVNLGQATSGLVSCLACGRAYEIVVGENGKRRARLLSGPPPPGATRAGQGAGRPGGTLEVGQKPQVDVQSATPVGTADDTLSPGASPPAAPAVPSVAAPTALCRLADWSFNAVLLIAVVAYFVATKGEADTTFSVILRMLGWYVALSCLLRIALLFSVAVVYAALRVAGNPRPTPGPIPVPGLTYGANGPVLGCGIVLVGLVMVVASFLVKEDGLRSALLAVGIALVWVVAPVVRYAFPVAKAGQGAAQ
ncbi:MAG: hypothetical protein PVJ27_11770 [Candidatus Brocadiaceae bacterium]|jgi:hypothetical protein